jgi:hypothetical protein
MDVFSNIQELDRYLDLMQKKMTGEVNWKTRRCLSSLHSEREGEGATQAPVIEGQILSWK